MGHILEKQGLDIVINNCELRRDLHVFVGPTPPYIHTRQDTLHGFLSLQFAGNGSTVTGRFYANDLTKPIDQFTIIK